MISPSPFLPDWLRQPRYHHQYLPDRLEYEPGALDRASLEHLRKLGHPLREIRPYGNMQIIVWDKRRGRLQAVSDPRSTGEGKVVLGVPVTPTPLTASRLQKSSPFSSLQWLFPH